MLTDKFPKCCKCQFMFLYIFCNLNKITDIYQIVKNAKSSNHTFQGKITGTLYTHVIIRHLHRSLLRHNWNLNSPFVNAFVTMAIFILLHHIIREITILNLKMFFLECVSNCTYVCVVCLPYIPLHQQSKTNRKIIAFSF